MKIDSSIPSIPTPGQDVSQAATSQQEFLNLLVAQLKHQNPLDPQDGAEVVAPPVINQGIVRFTSEDGDHDRRTDEVIERVQNGGVVWFGGSDFKGRRVMRVPVLSWRTTSEDIDKAIDAVRSALSD